MSALFYLRYVEPCQAKRLSYLFTQRSLQYMTLAMLQLTSLASPK